MGIWKDLIGTTATSLKIGKAKATLDASGLSAARTFTLPDKTGTVSLVGDAAASAVSLTLTAASAKVQRLSPTAHGMYVKLPDATTMVKGADHFVLSNSSLFFVRVLDSTGVLRGFVGPSGQVYCSLHDISTAAGGWVLNGSKLFGIAAYLQLTATYANGASPGQAVVVALDSTRAIFIHQFNGLSAVVYDVSTNTWGSVTQIRGTANVSNYAAVLSSANAVLVTSCSNTTALQGVVLSVSGTTITVNTAGTATLAGNITAASPPNIGMQLIAVTGGGFAVAYTRATTVHGIRGISISGTTVTIGAEVSLGTTPAVTNTPHIFDCGANSVILAVGVNAASSTLYYLPLSLSGSTLTGGSGGTLGTSISGVNIRTIKLTASKVVVAWNEGGTSLSAACITVVTGSNSATASTATGLATLTSLASVGTTADMLLVSTSKVLFCYGTTTSTIFVIFSIDGSNVLTGASVTYSNSTRAAQCAAISISGTDVRCAQAGNSTDGNYSYVYTVDCSTATPVASVVESLQFQTFPDPSLQRGCTRNPQTIRSGIGYAKIGINTTMVIGQTATAILNDVLPVQQAPGVAIATNGDYETWSMAQAGNNNTPPSICIVQGAQP